MNFELWTMNYKRIYIYIILRQKSVKFNYFSNLPICRRSANSLNRRKLLICRAIPQSFDLHNITKVENQTKNSSKQISNDENKRKKTQIWHICKEKRKIRRQTSLSVSPLLPIRRTMRKKNSLFVAQKLLRCRGQPPMESHVTYIYVAYFQRKHLYFKHIRASN